MMILAQHEVLRTDISGMPLEWIDVQQAVKLICLEQVGYSFGPILYTVRGGINAITGLRSEVAVNAILATHGMLPGLKRFDPDYAPPLSNPALFRRDQNLCLYCGGRFPVPQLSRDHVRPLIQRGADHWNNVVSACKPCNNLKGGRTPEQAHMQLLAIPFTPSHAEYVYLQGKRILADQMDFLLSHFPRNSPLLARVREHIRAA